MIGVVLKLLILIRMVEDDLVWLFIVNGGVVSVVKLIGYLCFGLSGIWVEVCDIFYVMFV